MDIDMAEVELEKLVLHFAQSNKAEGKSGEGITLAFCYLEGYSLPRSVGANTPLWLKGGDTMPIKWSALRVSEAMDMVEEFVGQATDPLEQAKIVATEARKIPNLPQYLDQRLNRLIISIERMDYIKSSIKAVREDLPDTALEAERRSERLGRQPALVI